MFVSRYLLSLPLCSVLVGSCACVAEGPRDASSPQQAVQAPPATVPAANGPVELPGQPVPENSPTMFPHPAGNRYLLSGQANIIFQAHAPFHSPYEGTNSFLGRGEYKTSLIGTVFLGYQLRRNPFSSTEVTGSVESAGGRGLSEALGLAGFTNLDVVRNPNLGSVPYLARVQVHQTIPLSHQLTPVDASQFQLGTQAPIRRIDLRAGKMSLPDYLDINAAGTDSHLQFMNWTVDNNGAWDYAADTRGYTYALLAQYTDHNWSAQYAIAAMPTVANGIHLDWALRRASGQNVQIERDGSLLGSLVPGRSGSVKLLGYVNHAHMGLYRESNAAFLNGLTPTPEITASERNGAVKYGVGLNVLQEITPTIRAFGRFGWNEGQHESFAYTEVDQTIESGGDIAGLQWRRPFDRLGVAFVTNAIKRDHQAYLALGGLGFLLGDGRLHYAREDILETYYTAHTWRGLFFAFDAQFVEHPGYNQDRGPVLVESVRAHVDF